MFHRLQRFTIRIVLPAVLLSALFYLHKSRALLQATDVHFATVFDGVYSYTKSQPEITTQASSEGGNGSYEIVRKFWTHLEHVLDLHRPPIARLEPTRKHIEQSFNEAWPDLVHEDLIPISTQYIDFISINLYEDT